VTFSEEGEQTASEIHWWRHARTGLRAARTRKPNALFDSIDGQRAILLCGLEQYLRGVLIAKNDALKRRGERVPVDIDFPVYGLKRTRVFANMVQQALVNFRRQFNHYVVHAKNSTTPQFEAINES
jgi:hypothetical protein